jgi:Protein of unknown function (DUF2612)
MFEPYIYRQYSNSPKLISLVQKTANAMLFKNIDFTVDYLDIRTANTDGLNNWGIILNQPRVVRSGLAYDGVFGFDDGAPPSDTTTYPQNFYHSNFFNISYSPTQELTNSQYRALLLLKYRKYTTNNSLKDLNDIIIEYADISGGGGIPYVFSTYDMNITYKFNYVPLPYETYLFKDTPILPKPAGVNLNLIFT